MSNTQNVLALLLQYGELSGVDLVRVSCGAVSKNAVYIVLQRLERKGIVESRLGIPVKCGFRMMKPRLWKLAPIVEAQDDADSAEAYEA